jgi:hypothetical protein
MQRARKASWRLTFTAWSTLLAVLGILTVTLGRRSLLLIERLVGQHDGWPIAVIAALVGLPLLVDAVRNVPHYRGVVRRRVLAGAAQTWSAAVPAPVPRRYRVRDGALTRRERVLVEQGQLGFGVVHRHGEHFSVHLTAPWGAKIGSMPVRPAGSPPREGSLAPILFDAGEHTGVAPSLLGLEFFAAPAADLRTILTASARRTEARNLVAPLWSTLHPLERLGHERDKAVGELTLADQRLTLAGLGDPITVRLDRPVRVELAVELRDDGNAELHVLVEPADDSAYRGPRRAALAFKTELPQRRIDRGVPQAWVDACYLAPDDFDALWPAIVAAAGDAALDTRVSLG